MASDPRYQIVTVRARIFLFPPCVAQIVIGFADHTTTTVNLDQKKMDQLSNDLTEIYNLLNPEPDDDFVPGPQDEQGGVKS